MTKIKIAIADDHELVRKGIRLLLEDIEGFSVIFESENGRKLIDYITSNKNLPDIVLVDINMPDLNGLETTIELKNLFPEIKIVALSVYNELHIIRDMIRSGANAYLHKDSNPEIFQNVLKEVYEKGFYYSKDVIDSLVNSNLKSFSSDNLQQN